MKPLRTDNLLSQLLNQQKKYFQESFTNLTFLVFFENLKTTRVMNKHLNALYNKVTFRIFNL